MQENPFRKRICKAFSSNAGFGGPIVGNDGGEIQMTFDQFVLMYSVFSDRAPREMKIHYAFLIYGKFDYEINMVEKVGVSLKYVSMYEL